MAETIQAWAQRPSRYLRPRQLPPFAQWPEIRLDGFEYPEWLNAAVELTDRMVERGFGDHTALIGNGRQRTYKELATGPTASPMR